MAKVLILSSDEVTELLPMGRAIAAVEEGFRLLGRGDVSIPDRLHISIAGKASWLLMPAVSFSKSSWMGIKLAAVFPDNRQRSLDTVQALYLLQDGDTGVPKALMDARSLTAIRTAATSALATKYLCDKESSVLGIFGTGTQARVHLAAMCAIAPIKEVLVCGRTPASSEAFVAQVAAGPKIVVRSAQAHEVLERARIICTCTSSETPVFDGRLLRQGTHVNGVGSYQPHTRELDTKSIQRARVVVDSYAGALREAGDLLIPIQEGEFQKEHIHAELSEVVLGKKIRFTQEEITLFKSTGHAVEDLVCAIDVYRRASEEGRGHQVPI